MSQQIDITPLVGVDRERFLRQNETRIRSAATTALAAGKTPDPLIAPALNAVLYCEDIIDRHDVAATANRAANRQHVAEDHERYVAKAWQLKLRALDQLAHLVI
jgi:hypothetical protein